MIWLIFALMVAVALALLVVPLVKGRGKAMARADYDLAVYKDQLTEIDRDLERGVLTADQAEAARLEVQRRMLGVADAAKRAAGPASPRRAVGAAVAIVLVVPALSFGVYGLLGSPSLPDLPHAGRTDPRVEAQQQAELFQGMVAQLAAKLEANPQDGKGWAMMGRSLRVLGQPEEARAAYRRAVGLLPQDATVRLEYGSLLLDEVPQGAPLPPEFVGLMREVVALQPSQPDALYFLGIGEAQAGRADKARALWTRLLEQLPADSEDRAEIQRMIDGLK